MTSPPAATNGGSAPSESSKGRILALRDPGCERGVSSPVLLRLAPHRLAPRVLALEPVGRAARAIRRALHLRHDALQPHLAGMGKHGRSVRLDVGIEAQTWSGALDQRCQGGLAGVEGLAPQIVAVQLNQVEGVQEDAGVMAAVADAVEARHAAVVAAHGLAVDDAGARA